MGSIEFFCRFFTGDCLRIYFSKPEVWFVSDAYHKRSKWILIIRSWYLRAKRISLIAILTKIYVSYSI